MSLGDESSTSTLASVSGDLSHQSTKVVRNKSMAIWNELDEDIWRSIFKKLNLTDHISFSGVCRLWRTIGLEYRNTYIPTHVPGLIIPGLSNSTSSQTRRFLAFPVGKKINYQSQGAQEDLPELSIPHISLCRGSHQGWLVMIDNTMNMYLQNPMSGAHIDLPSVTSIPKTRPGDTPMSKWYVYKAFLSSSPSLTNYDCFVLLFYEPGDLAFCRVGDKAWKVIEAPETWESIDAIFYREKFYLVDEYGLIYVVSKKDLTSSTGLPKLIKLGLTPPRPFYYTDKWYLVECGNKLFQIHRDGSEEEDFYNVEFGQEEEVNNDEFGEEEDVDNDNEFDTYDYDNNYNAISRYFVNQTDGFQVFKLDISNGLDCEIKWVRVKDLDGGAIFLGFNQSFGLSNSNLMGYKGDRIYYTDDDYAAQKLQIRSGHDVGIYNLEDSSFEPLYSTEYESTKPTAVWITPMI